MDDAALKVNISNLPPCPLSWGDLKHFTCYTLNMSAKGELYQRALLILFYNPLTASGLILLSPALECEQEL